MNTEKKGFFAGFVDGFTGSIGRMCAVASVVLGAAALLLKGKA